MENIPQTFERYEPYGTVQSEFLPKNHSLRSLLCSHLSHQPPVDHRQAVSNFKICVHTYIMRT